MIDDQHKPLPDAAGRNREADSRDEAVGIPPSDAVRDFAAPSNGLSGSRRPPGALTDDELRDELVRTISQALHDSGYSPIEDWAPDVEQLGTVGADAALPVVRRYADAQVTAERERAAAFPKPNLSRLNEMDGYLGELARTTGDDGPLVFWREIRRSINAPVREHIERVMRGMQP